MYLSLFGKYSLFFRICFRLPRTNSYPNYAFISDRGIHAWLNLNNRNLAFRKRLFVDHHRQWREKRSGITESCV